MECFINFGNLGRLTECGGEEKNAWPAANLITVV